IGPSGTGKSTLLRCINLLVEPRSGHIYIDDEEITAPDCDINRIRQRLGMVFQNFNLFNHLTVIENIMLSPVKLKGLSRQEAYDKSMELLRLVGLGEKVFSYPDELSGGQKQRIAIARALAMDPQIIMFDEPTSALDPTMVGEVEAVIRQLAEMGKTMLIVTHEMNFARAISNRVFYMDEGGIYEEGTPEEIFDHPQKENTRRFVQNLKVLSLEINSRNYDFLSMASQIENYCNKNQIAPKATKRILLVFEEITQLLMQKLDSPVIKAVCEYSESEESANWTISYSGPAMDVSKAEDELGMTVLKGMTDTIEYSWNEDSKTGNQLYLKVK
ncbi:MAG: amino acid ABC transporter ATP-binding protein, partial [Erysipelotrichaceae bacterium]|nr:amino acid ABC transporter ATP-binding protein [Erysipelotrichaceae bacterium]